jgi:hypothetical protein
MISKKHFLNQMKKLMTIYDEQISTDRLLAYYDAMSTDFTDEQFDLALNLALKNSFKFPPIAAFYKKDESRPEEKKVYEPVTAEESKRIKEAFTRAGL